MPKNGDFGIGKNARKLKKIQEKKRV